MQQNSQPFSSGLLLYKSGNVESLGHRKGHGVNYFSGHEVIIIRMLRISHEICLVIKEFEETQINEIEPLGSSENTWHWERTALLGLILMSCLPDRRGVCLRWCLWEQQGIGLCLVPFSSNKCSSLVGSDWNPQYSCFHCTLSYWARAPLITVGFCCFPHGTQNIINQSPSKMWLKLLLSALACQRHGVCSHFIFVRNTLKCGDNLSGWQHKGSVIFLFAWSMWRLCFFLVCISLQFWVIASGPAESSCSLSSGIWATFSPPRGREFAAAKQHPSWFIRIYWSWGDSTKILFCGQAFAHPCGADGMEWRELHTEQGGSLGAGQTRRVACHELCTSIPWVISVGNSLDSSWVTKAPFTSLSGGEF